MSITEINAIQKNCFLQSIVTMNWLKQWHWLH